LDESGGVSARFGTGGLVSGAPDYRQSGIAREAFVRARKFAEEIARSRVATDNSGVHARIAEAGRDVGDGSIP
jgi:hypothetical protein